MLYIYVTIIIINIIIIIIISIPTNGYQKVLTFLCIRIIHILSSILYS